MNQELSIIYRKADLGKRLIAGVIDWVIILFLIVFAELAFELEGEPGLIGLMGVLMCIVSFPLLILYFFFKDGLSKGQSYGKRYMNLMVIGSESGKPCNKIQSAIRQVLFTLLSLIECIITLLQGEGRRLGDFVAKTQVIDFAEYEKQKNAPIS